MTEQELEARRIPIEWYVPESIVSRYATNIVVQHGEHEFVISFHEMQPPVLLGTPEEVEAGLEQIESIRANCVARVVVAAERMPDFIQVLQESLARYSSKKEAE